MIIRHQFVPDNFGAGVIVPVVKDKSGNLNDINNYRPITLIPIISKLFECVIMELCNDYLVTDDLQFGFKKGRSCNDAIFAVKSTVNYSPIEVVVFMLQLWTCLKPLTLSTIINCLVH